MGRMFCPVGPTARVCWNSNPSSRRAHDRTAQSDYLPIIGRPVTTRFFGKSGKTRKMPRLPDRSSMPHSILGLAAAEAWLAGTRGLSGPSRASGAARCAAVLALAALALASTEGCDNPRAGSVSDHTSVGGSHAVVGAQTPVHERTSLEPAAPLPDAQDLLRAAIQTLEANRSIQASIRHETTMLGRRVVGRGVYLEQQARPWPQVRLELSTQMGEKTGSLVQVCDGRYLWTFDSLAEQPRVEKVDLVRIAEALDERPGPEAPEELSRIPIFYGLPRLLWTVSGRFAFSRSDPGRWGRARQAVWRMEGQWVARQAVAHAAPTPHSGSPNAPIVARLALPPLVPDRVVVVLEQQTLFPLRIEFRWTRDGPLGHEPAVAVDLFDVKLDVPLDPTWFSYSPGNLEVVDQTPQAIEHLRR